MVRYLRMHVRRLWIWRGLMLAALVLPFPVIGWLLTRGWVSTLGSGCILVVFIMLAILAGMRAEILQDDAAMAGTDRLILGRLRLSVLRNVLVAVGLAALIPAGCNFCIERLHFSQSEAFVAVAVPYWLIVGNLRRVWPISAGSTKETMRGLTLIADRDRRQAVWMHAAFAGLWLLDLASWWPQLVHAALHQKVDLWQFQVFGIFGVSSLFMLYGPRRLFEGRLVRAIVEDESLREYRALALRNAFLTLACGLLVVCELVVRNGRLAVVMLPLVFGASQAMGFATVAILEFRAGGFTPEDDTTARGAEA